MQYFALSIAHLVFLLRSFVLRLWPTNGKKKRFWPNFQCICSPGNSKLCWLLFRRLAISRWIKNEGLWITCISCRHVGGRSRSFVACWMRYESTRKFYLDSCKKISSIHLPLEWAVTRKGNYLDSLPNQVTDRFAVVCLVNKLQIERISRHRMHISTMGHYEETR